MKTKNIIIYIIICLIIIAGIAVWDSHGFNTELQYSSRYQIQLSNNTGIDKKDVEEIATEVLGDTRFFVQEVESFGNSVSIVAEEMTEEQKNQIVEKFNEKYDEDLKADDIEIVFIAFTRVKDVVKHFIFPGILTLAFVLGYFLIRFRKIGVLEILIKTIAFPVVAELLMFSIMAIIRVPFGRLSIALAVGLYVATIAGLTKYFEEKKNKITEETEKSENVVEAN